MNNKGFTFKKRLAGFKYAFHGIRLLFKQESNAQLQVIIGICAIIAGFLLKISVMEWIVVVAVCGCVLAAEALNTAIEKLSDVISPEYSEAIKKIKDVSAGGVLLIALAALIIGGIIFIPKLAALFS
jgi:diacylglycerol kinase (ATP)